MASAKWFRCKMKRWGCSPVGAGRKRQGAWRVPTGQVIYPHRVEGDYRKRLAYAIRMVEVFSRMQDER